MGSTERRERERKELRTKILDAARELFGAEGVEAVTMRRIAEKIEYSPTAIYLHFPDKEALVRELCEHDFVAFAKHFAAAAQAADPIARLRKSAHVYVDFAMEHPGQYRFMFMSLPREPAEQTSVDRTNPEQNAYAFLQMLVAELYDQKLVRSEFPDPEMVCQLLWAAVHGIACLHLTKSREPWVEFRPVRKSVDAMIDALFHGILDPKELANRTTKAKKNKARK